MKTITKDIETTALIPTKVIKPTTLYVTDDGKEFFNETDAIQYEYTKEIKETTSRINETYKLTNVDLFSIDSCVTILYINDLTNPSLRDDLTFKFGWKEIDYHFNEFKNGWNIVSRYDGGDYTDTLTIYPIDPLINKLKNDITTLENIVKGKVSMGNGKIKEDKEIRDCGDYLEVELTQDKWAKIDKNDKDLVSQYSWYYKLDGFKSDKSIRKGYARANICVNDIRTSVSMHRLILQNQLTTEQNYVDHKNGDTLDNRRKNIFPCTLAENAYNRKGYGVSGYKGVYLTPSGKYKAQITFNYKQIHIGIYDTAEQAARAYDLKAVELFRSAAKLNFEKDREKYLLELKAKGINYV